MSRRSGCSSYLVVLYLFFAVLFETTRATNCISEMEETACTDQEQPVLALPAPPSSEEEEQGGEGVKMVQVGGESIKLDKLGPMVLNTDGSFSRITNWHEMSEYEQSNTLRVIAKRNKERRTALAAKMGLSPEYI